MRRAFIALALALTVAGCAGQGLFGTPVLNVNTSVSRNTMQGVIATYGTLLSAERGYKMLPLCRTGTHATITNPCAQRSVIVRLQAADARANRAINSAVIFIRTYPTVDASNLIAAANTAVSELQAILSETGVR